VTIKIIVDEEVVHEIDERAYRKNILNMSFWKMGQPLHEEHISMPIARDIDIQLHFSNRPDTDLLMLEEKARLDSADKDEERNAAQLAAIVEAEREAEEKRIAEEEALAEEAIEIEVIPGEIEVVNSEEETPLDLPPTESDLNVESGIDVN